MMYPGLLQTRFMSARVSLSTGNKLQRERSNSGPFRPITYCNES